MAVLALDSSTRIVEVLGYSGAGALVGLLTGVVLRAMFRDVKKAANTAKRAARAARRNAESALVTADDARNIAWEARDEAHLEV